MKPSSINVVYSEFWKHSYHVRQKYVDFTRFFMNTSIFSSFCYFNLFAYYRGIKLNHYAYLMRIDDHLSDDLILMMEAFAL